MNTDQAIDLLDRCVASVPANRQSHAELMQAVAIVRAALAAAKETPAAKAS